MEPLTRFRSELADWLELNCPPSMRTPMPDSESPLGGSRIPPPNPETAIWMNRCADRGLTLPLVPKEYGGGGMTHTQAAIYYEELDRLGMRLPLMGTGPAMVAPTLVQFGTDEQKLYYLPRIVRGIDRWAQGFSEPEAGSDLAALRLAAVREGEEYVLNGQKIWNSWADKSDMLITLVRTDPRAQPRQRGISILMINLDLPGVIVRPIRMLNGDAEFCEVFFDNVRVPVSCRLGPENDGWSVTKWFLVADRRSSRRWFDAIMDLDLPSLWRASGDPSPELASNVAANELDQIAINLTLDRVERLEAEGQNVDLYANVIKYWQMEHLKRRYDLASLLGENFRIGWSDELQDKKDIKLTKEWLYSRAHSLGGGSSEVQLNIIAKHGLHLPGA